MTFRLFGPPLAGCHQIPAGVAAAFVRVGGVDIQVWPVDPSTSEYIVEGTVEAARYAAAALGLYCPFSGGLDSGCDGKACDPCPFAPTEDEEALGIDFRVPPARQDICCGCESPMWLYTHSGSTYCYPVCERCSTSSSLMSPAPDGQVITGSGEPGLRAPTWREAYRLGWVVHNPDAPPPSHGYGGTPYPPEGPPRQPPPASQIAAD
jgi:hypothetical protein